MIYTFCPSEINKFDDCCLSQPDSVQEHMFGFIYSNVMIIYSLAKCGASCECINSKYPVQKNETVIKPTLRNGLNVGLSD